MGRLKVQQINDHLYLLNDNDEATGYLVTGSDRALIIDTMNGLVDVKEEAEKLTSLPLTVVNTHGHPDHIYGNIFFEEAYIHPDDAEIAEKYLQRPEFAAICKESNRTCAKFMEIREGETIDLGGIHLAVYKVPGHTPGGIVLLDKEDRILFTGDSIIEQTWMHLEESLPIETFYDALKALQSIRKEFDYLLTGHGKGLDGASLCEAQLEAVREMCEGKSENDVEYEWFGGVDMAHPYGDGHRCIVYRSLQNSDLR